MAERASATTLPGGFVEDVVATGLTFPTGIAELPDGRILVTEKAGVIKVIKNGQLLSTPFVDLSANVNNFWDRGLTGIAVDPNFGTNHHIYLFYPYDSAGNDGSGPVVNRLVRITAAGDVMQSARRPCSWERRPAPVRLLRRAHACHKSGTATVPTASASLVTGPCRVTGRRRQLGLRR